MNSEARTVFLRRALPAAATLALALGALGATADPFTAADLVRMERISDPRVSPDGRSVVYVQRTTDLEENRGRTDLWLAAIDGSRAPRRLTDDPENDGDPRFASDGSIYFLSSRSGSSQIWHLPARGGAPRQVSDLPLDVANLQVSPTGDLLAFTLEVFPECRSVECTTRRLEEREKRKASGQGYDRLFVRHWDAWKDGRRSHLFVMPARGGRGAAPRDLTQGLDADVPSKPFGDASEFAFTPDGRGLVFAAREAGTGEPWSTNFDLYYVPADGSAAPRLLTDNPAWDTGPVFSPDGRLLAYRAMARPGYEADRFAIRLREWTPSGPGRRERELAPRWDRSPQDLVFSADGRTLYATAQDRGEVALFAIDVTSGDVRRLLGDGHVRSPALAGDLLVVGRDDLDSPVDLYTLRPDGSGLRQITHANRERLAAIDFGAYRQLSFRGAGGETVYGYVVEPVGRVPGRRYPLAFLIHGGPQGSFDNDFHYRWNPQVYAGAGYGVVMIDFHGSTGYGQAFTDSIRDDWGGKPLEDLKRGLAYALERFDWLDGERACALGASYGGYMINWIAGNWPDRFRCLVNHDGIFDTRMMYYTTEELWFPEWEFGGTPWTRPQGFERPNPALHVEHWQTPMLVIHGALDFRVPETQGLAAFTALQRRGIPSRLLYFPDENHWVLKPANSLQWHREVLDWLGRYTGGGPEVRDPTRPGG